MAGYTLAGRPAFRRQSVATLTKVTIDVTWRRLIGRPLCREWSWSLECATLFLREQLRAAFAFADRADGREYLDSLVFNPPDALAVTATLVTAPVRGMWIEPSQTAARRTMLYFHGGGYAFYYRGHAHMIGLFAEHARARTFALDYRLAPAHPHPAQLEDAVAAYRWLLDSGVAPADLIVGGDSAGGHLTLMLLAELIRLGMPQPALAIGISPWTDIGARGRSFYENDRYDNVLSWMALQFGWWYQGEELSREALSPIHATLAGAAPIYLQAGEKEILVDMIRDFADAARAQGVDAVLDVWPHMTHEFQAYGSMLPESRDALARLARVVDAHLPTTSAVPNIRR